MLQSIINQLNAADSQARIEALYTLAMVEETEALPLLTSMWSRETDAEVKKVLNWAGAQINAARKRDYSTIEAMVEAYRLAPVGSEQTPGTTSDDKQTTEEVFLRKMAGDIEAQRRLEQIQREYGATDTADKIGGLADGFNRVLRVSQLTGFLGVAQAASNLAASSISPSQAELVDNALKQVQLEETLANARPKAIIPPRPSESNVKVWLNKLNNSDPSARISALNQLADFNNPQALGAIATCFVRDSEANVRQKAQQVGKTMYFSARYWQDAKPGTDRATELYAKAQALRAARGVI